MRDDDPAPELTPERALTALRSLLEMEVLFGVGEVLRRWTPQDPAPRDVPPPRSAARVDRTAEAVPAAPTPAQAAPRAGPEKGKKRPARLSSSREGAPPSVSHQADLFSDPSSRFPGALSPEERRSALEALAREASGCTLCRLSEERTHVVFGEGDPCARLMFVGEGPGADEDSQGRPFVGRAGQLLDKMIEAMGLRREQVYIANVVKCRPPGNRYPEKDEVASCTPYLDRQLAIIRPDVICTLGSCATRYLLRTGRGITSLRGQVYQVGSSRVVATYHPAYLIRNPSAKREAWEDLQKVMKELGL